MGQGNGSTYQTRDNSGSLFKNDRKTSENHPNAKGKALIGGQWYWVSAWTKSGQRGPWQSLSFELMTEGQVAQYGNTGGNQQQRGGHGGGTRPAGPQRQQQRPQQRQADPPPFGDEQQFAEADIPF